jgi:predicted O-methyltransferase YrrM
MGARHAEISAVSSLDDDPARPSDRLLDIAELAIKAAREVSMEPVSSRITSGQRWPDIWPGEHYKLLAALVAVTDAKRVVEIGTHQGLSALALMQTLPAGGSLATFDIMPFREVPGYVLRDDDFADGRLTQFIADITTDAGFAEHRELLRDADLIFVDAAKDGHQERVFLQRFEDVGFTNMPLIVFDDIRVYNMLRIWREIRRPKLDVTSFGHWSGTGLVDYESSL